MKAKRPFGEQEALTKLFKNVQLFEMEKKLWTSVHDRKLVSKDPPLASTLNTSIKWRIRNCKQQYCTILDSSRNLNKPLIGIISSNLENYQRIIQDDQCDNDYYSPQQNNLESFSKAVEIRCHEMFNWDGQRVLIKKSRAQGILRPPCLFTKINFFSPLEN